MLKFKKNKVIQAISILLVVFVVPKYSIAKTPKKYCGMYSGTYSDSIYTSTITLNLKNDELYSCNISVKNIKTSENYIPPFYDLCVEFPLNFCGKWFVKKGFLYLSILNVDYNGRTEDRDTLCHLTDSTLFTTSFVTPSNFIYNYVNGWGYLGNNYYTHEKIFCLDGGWYYFNVHYDKYKIEKSESGIFQFDLRLTSNRIKHIWTGNKTYIIKQ